MEKIKNLMNKIDRKTFIVLAVCLLLFTVTALWANSGKQPGGTSQAGYVLYENGTVKEILSDSTFSDEVSDGGYRGEQMMTVEITTGSLKGKTLLAYNFVGPLYGVPVNEGDSVTLTVSVYEDGSMSASVYELNHLPALLITLAVFAAVIIAVGGGKGFKSLIGLVFIIISLFFILLPALLKGAPTVLTTLLVCLFTAAFSLTIMSGVNTKTICAFLGTVSGMAMALLMSWLAQKLFRINGLRLSDAEAILQIRQGGVMVGIKGLLSAGIVISTLGAVMDVAMGLVSSIAEVHEANGSLTVRELFVSGMNIGKDMVGTMTSTLITALLGSELVLMLYLFSLSLGKYQLLSSSYVAIETISALSCSIGVVLSIPITNLIAARTFGSRQQQ